jgi:hypothetical protein
MDHQARYSSYHKSIILTMTLFFIFPPLLFNTTYFIHVVTLVPYGCGSMTHAWMGRWPRLTLAHDLLQWTRVEERGSVPKLCDYGCVLQGAGDVWVEGEPPYPLQIADMADPLVVLLGTALLVAG